jgi:hypothetical protein
MVETRIRYFGERDACLLTPLELRQRLDLDPANDFESAELWR